MSGKSSQSDDSSKPHISSTGKSGNLKVLEASRYTNARLLHKFNSGSFEPKAMDEILSQWKDKLLDNLADFGPPKDASKAKVEEDSSISKPWRDTIYLISEIIHADQWQIALLARATMTLARDAAHDSPQTRHDIISMHFSEKSSILLLLQAVFQASLDEEHQYHASCLRLATELRSLGIVEKLLTSLSSLLTTTHTTVLQRHYANNPHIVALWADQCLAEQLLLLQALFVICHVTPNTPQEHLQSADLFLRLARVLTSSQFGYQQPVLPYATDVGRRRVERVSQTGMMLLLELLHLGDVLAAYNAYDMATRGEFQASEGTDAIADAHAADTMDAFRTHTESLLKRPLLQLATLRHLDETYFVNAWTTLPVHGPLQLAWATFLSLTLELTELLAQVTARQRSQTDADEATTRALVIADRLQAAQRLGTVQALVGLLMYRQPARDGEQVREVGVLRVHTTLEAIDDDHDHVQAYKLVVADLLAAFFQSKCYVASTTSTPAPPATRSATAVVVSSGRPIFTHGELLPLFCILVCSHPAIRARFWQWYAPTRAGCRPGTLFDDILMYFPMVGTNTSIHLLHALTALTQPLASATLRADGAGSALDARDAYVAPRQATLGKRLSALARACEAQVARCDAFLAGRAAQEDSIALASGVTDKEAHARSAVSVLQAIPTLTTLMPPPHLLQTDAGDLSSATLRADWRSPAGIIIPAGTRGYAVPLPGTKYQPVSSTALVEDTTDTFQANNVVRWDLSWSAWTLLLVRMHKVLEAAPLGAALTVMPLADWQFLVAMLHFLEQIADACPQLLQVVDTAAHTHLTSAPEGMTTYDIRVNAKDVSVPVLAARSLRFLAYAAADDSFNSEKWSHCVLSSVSGMGQPVLSGIPGLETGPAMVLRATAASVGILNAHLTLAPQAFVRLFSRYFMFRSHDALTTRATGSQVSMTVAQLLALVRSKIESPLHVFPVSIELVTMMSTLIKHTYTAHNALSHATFMPMETSPEHVHTSERKHTSEDMQDVPASPAKASKLSRGASASSSARALVDAPTKALTLTTSFSRAWQPTDLLPSPSPAEALLIAAQPDSVLAPLPPAPPVSALDLSGVCQALMEMFLQYNAWQCADARQKWVLGTRLMSILHYILSMPSPQALSLSTASSLFAPAVLTELRQAVFDTFLQSPVAQLALIKPLITALAHVYAHPRVATTSAPAAFAAQGMALLHCLLSLCRATAPIATPVPDTQILYSPFLPVTPTASNAKSTGPTVAAAASLADVLPAPVPEVPLTMPACGTAQLLFTLLHATAPEVSFTLPASPRAPQNTAAVPDTNMLVALLTTLSVALPADLKAQVLLTLAYYIPLLADTRQPEELRARSSAQLSSLSSLPHLSLLRPVITDALHSAKAPVLVKQAILELLAVTAQYHPLLLQNILTTSTNSPSTSSATQKTAALGKSVVGGLLHTILSCAQQDAKDEEALSATYASEESERSFTYDTPQMYASTASKALLVQALHVLCVIFASRSFTDARKQAQSNNELWTVLCNLLRSRASYTVAGDTGVVPAADGDGYGVLPPAPAAMVHAVSGVGVCRVGVPLASSISLEFAPVLDRAADEYTLNLLGATYSLRIITNVLQHRQASTLPAELHTGLASLLAEGQHERWLQTMTRLPPNLASNSDYRRLHALTAKAAAALDIALPALYTTVTPSCLSTFHADARANAMLNIRVLHDVLNADLRALTSRLHSDRTLAIQALTQAVDAGTVALGSADDVFTVNGWTVTAPDLVNAQLALSDASAEVMMPSRAADELSVWASSACPSRQSAVAPEAEDDAASLSGSVGKAGQELIDDERFWARAMRAYWNQRESAVDGSAAAPLPIGLPAARTRDAIDGVSCTATHAGWCSAMSWADSERSVASFSPFRLPRGWAHAVPVAHSADVSRDETITALRRMLLAPQCPIWAPVAQLRVLTSTQFLQPAHLAAMYEAAGPDAVYVCLYLAALGLTAEHPDVLMRLVRKASQALRLLYLCHRAAREWRLHDVRCQFVQQWSGFAQTCLAKHPHYIGLGQLPAAGDLAMPKSPFPVTALPLTYIGSLAFALAQAQAPVSGLSPFGAAMIADLSSFLFTVTSFVAAPMRSSDTAAPAVPSHTPTSLLHARTLLSAAEAKAILTEKFPSLSPQTLNAITGLLANPRVSALVQTILSSLATGAKVTDLLGTLAAELAAVVHSLLTVLNILAINGGLVGNVSLSATLSLLAHPQVHSLDLASIICPDEDAAYTVHIPAAHNPSLSPSADDGTVVPALAVLLTSLREAARAVQQVHRDRDEDEDDDFMAEKPHDEPFLPSGGFGSPQPRRSLATSFTTPTTSPSTATSTSTAMVLRGLSSATKHALAETAPHAQPPSAAHLLSAARGRAAAQVQDMCLAIETASHQNADADALVVANTPALSASAQALMPVIAALCASATALLHPLLELADAHNTALLQQTSQATHVTDVPSLIPIVCHNSPLNALAAFLPFIVTATGVPSLTDQALPLLTQILTALRAAHATYAHVLAQRYALAPAEALDCDMDNDTLAAERHALHRVRALAIAAESEAVGLMPLLVTLMSTASPARGYRAIAALRLIALLCSQPAKPVALRAPTTTLMSTNAVQPLPLSAHALACMPLVIVALSRHRMLRVAASLFEIDSAPSSSAAAAASSSSSSSMGDNEDATCGPILRAAELAAQPALKWVVAPQTFSTNATDAVSLALSEPLTLSALAYTAVAERNPWHAFYLHALQFLTLQLQQTPVSVAKTLGVNTLQAVVVQFLHAFRFRLAFAVRPVVLHSLSLGAIHEITSTLTFITRVNAAVPAFRLAQPAFMALLVSRAASLTAALSHVLRDEHELMNALLPVSTAEQQSSAALPSTQDDRKATPTKRKPVLATPPMSPALTGPSSSSATSTSTEEPATRTKTVAEEAAQVVKESTSLFSARPTKAKTAVSVQREGTDLSHQLFVGVGCRLAAPLTAKASGQASFLADAHLALFDLLHASLTFLTDATRTAHDTLATAVNRSEAALHFRADTAFPSPAELATVPVEETVTEVHLPFAIALPAASPTPGKEPVSVLMQERQVIAALPLDTVLHAHRPTRASDASRGRYTPQQNLAHTAHLTSASRKVPQLSYVTDLIRISAAAYYDIVIATLPQLSAPLAKALQRLRDPELLAIETPEHASVLAQSLQEALAHGSDALGRATRALPLTTNTLGATKTSPAALKLFAQVQMTVQTILERAMYLIWAHVHCLTLAHTAVALSDAAAITLPSSVLALVDNTARMAAQVCNLGDGPIPMSLQLPTPARLLVKYLQQVVLSVDSRHQDATVKTGELTNLPLHVYISALDSNDKVSPVRGGLLHAAAQHYGVSGAMVKDIIKALEQRSKAIETFSTRLGRILDKDARAASVLRGALQSQTASDANTRASLFVLRSFDVSFAHAMAEEAETVLVELRRQGKLAMVVRSILNKAFEDHHGSHSLFL